MSGANTLQFQNENLSVRKAWSIFMNLNLLSRQEICICNGLIGVAHFFKGCQERQVAEWSLSQGPVWEWIWALAQEQTEKWDNSDLRMNQPCLPATQHTPRQRWQHSWRPAYLVYSNEKCVPVCQFLAVKWSLFHIYWGLARYNAAYKIETAITFCLVGLLRRW
jgi:hypothetical protein